ncbi:MAG TPA: GntR family transcriptional regulator [Fimbriimonadaceae bacterium]|jgi:LacI family transcriptional regulator
MGKDHSAKSTTKDSPIVTSVVSRILAMIREGSLAVDCALPSERELSERFSTSRGVIRAAIRDLSISGVLETKSRCRPVVVGNGAPARTNGSSKRHIGIWLWPNTSDYAASSILKGIQSAGLGIDVRLMIASAIDSDWSSIFDAEARFLESIADEPVGAGLITWYLGGERNLPSLLKLRQAGVPMVFLDRLPPEELSADFVGTDNEGCARKAVQHLIDLGHRKIALISNIDAASSVKDRESGYKRALRDAGISFNEDYIQRDQVDTPEGVEAALDTLFGLQEPPTAIFAVNDHIALQIYEALQSRKISVPNHVSVVGFDGLLRWVPGGGYLTTFQQDFQRMGQLAAEIMIQRLDNGAPKAYKHVLLDAPFTDRGSTAQPKSIISNSNMPSMENI